VCASQIPSSFCQSCCNSKSVIQPNLLQDAAVDDGSLSGESRNAVLLASLLNSLHNVHRLFVCHLPEDDVAIVKPGRDHRGDEELGAVRVWSSIGHREQARSIVFQFEALVSKLLAVDGFATSAVATSEVTTLKHEIRDDSVERRALVSETVDASAEFFEILSRPRDLLVVHNEIDAAFVEALGSLPLHFEVSLGFHLGR